MVWIYADGLLRWTDNSILLEVTIARNERDDRDLR